MSFVKGILYMCHNYGGAVLTNVSSNNMYAFVDNFMVIFINNKATTIMFCSDNFKLIVHVRKLYRDVKVTFSLNSVTVHILTLNSKHWSR